MEFSLNKEIRRFARKVYYALFYRIVYRVKLFLYWNTIPKRVKRIRAKDCIRVLFVVSEVSTWKSELLYKAMLNHPRFAPVIGVSTSRIPWGAKEPLISFLKEKGYPFVDLDEEGNSIRSVSPDIVFYYKPYPECYSEGHFFNRNLQFVFGGLDYCIEATKHAAHLEKELFDYCWQFYVEHPEVLQRRKEILGYRSRNTRYTGVPMQDLLLLPKEHFKDPWVDRTGKKRIIYAPHHSIQGTNGRGIEFATFLDFGDAMLSFAKKYKDEIAVAFKPHPNLYLKLIDIWGEERTKAYYMEWERLPNTQLETGEYVGLFKYSDAIIHDCASFIVEYLYMDNPSLYLVAETNSMADMFDYVRNGFEVYEHGCSLEEIEGFIQRVIRGEDVKKDMRRIYREKNLLPPGGKNACDNIIESILG